MLCVGPCQPITQSEVVITYQQRPKLILYKSVHLLISILKLDILTWRSVGIHFLLESAPEAMEGIADFHTSHIFSALEVAAWLLITSCILVIREFKG